MKIFSFVLAVASAISKSTIPQLIGNTISEIQNLKLKSKLLGSLESLQECSTCLEENDFSAAACDNRCDNQSQSILDMLTDIGSDGMAYSGMMKRGKVSCDANHIFSNNQDILTAKSVSQLIKKIILNAYNARKE